MREGGNAIDGAVATAFALAVTHPTAGNIGGGGFIVYRAADGTATTFDFREMAPAGANPTMWMKDGKYDFDLHHNTHRSVGVPGTVAGLHLAWQKHGSKPWKDLVLPAVALARDGFEVTEGLARSLAGMLVEPDDFKKYPASLAQFSKNGQPYEPGDTLKQPDLARTLQRIADQGPAGFYEGETAALIEKEMKANSGLITRDDLKNYRAKERAPIKGTYRGYDVIGMAPPSSGGIAVVAHAERARGLRPQGQRLRVGAEPAPRRRVDAPGVRRPRPAPRRPRLRQRDSRSISSSRRTTPPRCARPSTRTRRRCRRRRRSRGRPSRRRRPTCRWSTRSATPCSMTYTLEYGYGSRIVVPGAGFLLNNEMGDFNSAPEMTDERGNIGTQAQPRPARQADAVEHVAVDPGPRRQAVHGHRLARRPHHHQHGAADHPQRGGLRNERAGSRRRRPPPPPVAARPDQLRALRLLGRHHRQAEGDGPHHQREGQPGRRRSDRGRQGRPPRRRRRSARRRTAAPPASERATAAAASPSARIAPAGCAR